MEKFLALGLSKRSSFSLVGSLIGGIKGTADNTWYIPQDINPQIGGGAMSDDYQLHEQVGDLMSYQKQVLSELKRQYMFENPNKAIRR